MKLRPEDLEIECTLYDENDCSLSIGYYNLKTQEDENVNFSKSELTNFLLREGYITNYKNDKVYVSFDTSEPDTYDYLWLSLDGYMDNHLNNKMAQNLIISYNKSLQLAHY